MAVQDGMEKLSRYGTPFMRADTDMPQCLLLFLHGMMSDDSIWLKWHADIEARIGSQIDAFMFRYQSKIHQKASITVAAKDLVAVLQSEQLAKYRHIFAITHSTGGLVIKKACRIDFEQTFADSEGSTPLDESFKRRVYDIEKTTLLGRLRTISNISVPHAGGTWYATIPGLMLYSMAGLPYYFPAELADYAARLCGKRPGIGYFRLAYQLVWHSPLLRRVEDDYQEVVGALDECDVAFPVSQEYLGNRDPVVESKYKRNIKRRSIDAPKRRSVAGIHHLQDLFPDISSDLPRSLFAFAKSLQESKTNDPPAALLRHTTLTVAAEMIRLHTEVDRSLSITRLISADGISNRADCQAAVWGKMCRSVGEIATIVITGLAGVGKSTVLRRLARKLVVDVLAGSESAPFPIYFNLREAREVTLTYEKLFAREDQDDVSELWAPLENWWIEAAIKLSSDLVSTKGAADNVRRWLRHLLGAARVVVILDGIDEFITRIKGADLADVKAIVRSLRRLDEDSKRITVVLGLRSGFAGTEDLPSRPQLLLTVGHLAHEEAAAFFGKELVKQVLSAVHANSPFRPLLLSPLVLATLTRDEANLQPERLNSLSGILDSALDAILSSALLSTRYKDAPVSIEAWKYMLAVLCWCLGTESESYVTENWVRRILRREGTRLLREILAVGSTASFSISDIRCGLRLCLDSGAVKALLSHSIFVNYRLCYYPTHQEWIDLGVARHLEMCLRLGIVADLARRTFYPTVFVVAAELINDYTITEKFLRKAFDASGGLLEQFIAGNVASILHWSHCAIDDGCLRFIFGHRRANSTGALEKLPPLAKHVWYAALLFRAVAKREGDRAAESLRSYLRDVLNEHFFGKERLSLCANTEHLVWCGLRMLCRDEKLPSPRVPVPTLDEGSIEESYRFACPGATGGERSEPHIKSLIVGYARAAAWLLMDNAKEAYVFDSVHYAWMACCAVRSGERSSDAENVLGDLLIGKNAKFYAQIVEEYSDIPELQQLYSTLRNVYSRRGTPESGDEGELGTDG